MMAPGQDYYHRLLDGEIYLVRDDEKLCLACAERRGLLSYRALWRRPLRPQPFPVQHPAWILLTESLASPPTSREPEDPPISPS